MIHNIEGNQLTNEILKNSKLVLVEFCINDSNPCQMQHEVLQKLEHHFSEKADIFRINIDESPEIKIIYHITSFPTILVFSNQKEVERIVGYIKIEELINIINELI